ncbi:MAG: glycosyltransferase family 4 protein [Maribacter sp.]|nr:glycosyltransferase family 4 protein [Maribacter sp.]
MGTKSNTLLIIGLVWPEPSTTAAGGRMLQLIDFFRTQNYKITFVSTAAKSQYSSDLKALGIKMDHIKLNDSSFDDFVKILDPSIVLFDRFLTEEQFGWRVAECVPNAVRILDTEDLHSLRQIREKCYRTNQEFTTTCWMQSDMTKREIASIFRCDLSLIISTFEMHLLLNVIRIDNSLLLHLPFQLDKIDSESLGSWPGFNARKDFICIGNGKHAPNIDAIVWLKKEIWPLIRKSLPNANLHVYGSYLPAEVRQMHNPKEGFHIEGWVENVHKVMRQSRINLAPLRFGAGIKGKLITAMQCGTPSITTPIGAEGMHGDLPWCGWVTDTAENFANAAVGLYNEAADWRQAQENGVDIINTFYDGKILDTRLTDKILSLRSDLKGHRESNFIGALIMYETMASTKYMSRWIEEKNRD